ncbi:MAG: hypothetical protein KRP56_06390 [Candidatus Methanogranum gryphiswaldense]|nr:MAG: hypothetical protein KRP56_06390 [Candidatus Methanogranum sp. U3.2.1]
MSSIKNSDQKIKKKKCFVISTIGKEDSKERMHADKFLKYIAKSIEEEYAVKRADEYSFSGEIKEKIIREIYESDLIIADLTFDNPNVYYELAFAHTINKPTIVFKTKKTEMYFDTKDMKIISYDDTFDYGNIDEIRTELIEIIKTNKYDNPIKNSLGLIELDKIVNKSIEQNKGSELSMVLEMLKTMNDKIESMDDVIGDKKSKKLDSDLYDMNIKLKQSKLVDTDNMMIDSLIEMIYEESDGIDKVLKILDALDAGMSIYMFVELMDKLDINKIKKSDYDKLKNYVYRK